MYHIHLTSTYFYNMHATNSVLIDLSFAKTPADQLRCCNIVTPMILARDRVISVFSPSPVGFEAAVAELRAGSASGFGFAPMITSQSMNTTSPNCSGLIHRETIASYCGSTNDVKLFSG